MTNTSAESNWEKERFYLSYNCWYRNSLYWWEVTVGTQAACCIIGAVRNTDRWMDSSCLPAGAFWFFLHFSCPVEFITPSQRVVLPTVGGVFLYQPDLDNFSFRFSCQVIVGCVKFTIKPNQQKMYLMAKILYYSAGFFPIRPHAFQVGFKYTG